MKDNVTIMVMSVVLICVVFTATFICLPANGENRPTVVTQNTEQKENKVVVIDCGHGGIDPGKTSAEGYKEKEINLAIGTYLKELLEQNNFIVVMTRTDDNGLYSESDSNKKVADMKKRCQIILESNADIVVSVHQNSFQDSRAKGAQVFYYKHSAQGKKLAECIQKSFKTNLDESNNRVEKADNTYYMLVHTKAPTIIAECGFLSNPSETKLLIDESYQRKVADAILKGILNYFEE